MKRVAFLVVGAGVIGLAVAAAIVFSGQVPVSARAPHSEVTRVVLHGTFKSSIANAAKSVADAPDLSDEGLISLGAQHYAQVCSSCHGGPGLGQSPLALSMRPSPQSLPAVVDQFDDKELFAILRDGVRFSAMPAWPAESNFDEIWAVVAFLRQLPGMTAEDYVALTGGLALEDVPAMPWGETGALADYAIGVVPAPEAEYLAKTPSSGWRPIGLNGAPVAACASCHGLDGKGGPTGGQAPNIAIQSPEFIAQRLRDYASGVRPSGIMAVAASSLSSEQIDEIAQYFGASTDASDAAGKESAAVPAPDTEGARIARAGLPEVSVPACGTCHSRSARAQRPAIPALAGQSASFLTRRLDSFAASPALATEGWNPMHNFSARMTPGQRSAVAGYLAALSPDDSLEPASRPVLDMARSAAAQSCVSCHGNDMTGGREGIAPNLTLQQADYLHHQLTLFHNDLRQNRLMEGVAHRDTLDELDALADWLGSLPPTKHASQAGMDGLDDIQRARAVEIVTNGLPDRNVPACQSCHNGAKFGMIPALNGQAEAYLSGRLDDFAAHVGDAEQVSPMSAIAARLTDLDRDALASYFASLDPLPK